MRNRTLCRRASPLLVFAVATAILWGDTATAPADAARRKAPRKALPGYAAALIVEQETGAILYEKNADALRAPASLTKMMTELLVLEAVEAGELSLEEIVTVPGEVRLVGGSRVRLHPGEKLPAGELLQAMAIASANDAALTLAIHIAGAESRFVERMNRRAGELGMVSTRYQNPHGLDRRDAPGTVTTARDQAVLARSLIRHPLALDLSSTSRAQIREGQWIRNTNRLLGQFAGMDGLKTGYTGKAGFCLTATAERDGMRLVSVLLGAPNNRRRFSETASILGKGFEEFARVAVIRQGQDIGQACSVPGGSPPQVRLVAGEDVALILPAKLRSSVRIEVDAPVCAASPLAAGQEVGRLRVMLGDSLIAMAPAVTSRAVRPSVSILPILADFTAE